jgi:hypothetical protein
MKAKILVGAIATLIYGTALAQDQQDESNMGGQDTQGQQSPDNIGGSGLTGDDNSDLIILDQEDVAPVTPETGVDEGVGVGGAGLQDDAFGGSGKAGQMPQQPKTGIPMQQGGVTLYCTPVDQASGGSGDLGIQQPLPSNEQSSLQRDYDVEVGEVDVNDDAFGGSGYEMKDEEKSDMRGLTVLIGGGVEGYTGGLAPEINPGATAGVTAALRPSKTFGLELGYTGAINNLDTDVGGSGPDIMRNGAQAALTFGLSAAPVQPYVLGGFGMNWYNVRNGEELGFRDDTSSKVPVGVGLRTHIGSLTADARVNYNILLSDDFHPVSNDDITTGSYNGTLNIGGTF